MNKSLSKKTNKNKIVFFSLWAVWCFFLVLGEEITGYLMLQYGYLAFSRLCVIGICIYWMLLGYSLHYIDKWNPFRTKKK